MYGCRAMRTCTMETGRFATSGSRHHRITSISGRIDSPVLWWTVSCASDLIGVVGWL